jgi:hypothetical protein
MKGRRRKNFDFHAKRRKEIVLHARFVGAMDTEDRARWLVAWALHNPGARNQVWSLMQTAQRMGGEITEAEAIAIADQAAEIPYLWKADQLAKYLGLTYAQRQALRLTAIGSVDIGKRARRVLRQRKDRLAKERKRRAAGMRPQSESLSAIKPWRELGMSRATWYRRNKARRRGETVLSAAIFLSCEERPVSPEGGAGLSKRRYRAEEKKEDFRLATATTLAADIYATLPLELRMAALCLSIPKTWARAA